MTTTQTTATWTVTDLGAVTLGRTTYRAERMTYIAGPLTGHSNTTLIGPRGAAYHLRGFTGQDTGLRQVISLKSGAPLRQAGNEVRVIELGDCIEVATRR